MSLKTVFNKQKYIFFPAKTLTLRNFFFSFVVPYFCLLLFVLLIYNKKCRHQLKIGLEEERVRLQEDIVSVNAALERLYSSARRSERRRRVSGGQEEGREKGEAETSSAVKDLNHPRRDERDEDEEDQQDQEEEDEVSRDGDGSSSSRRRQEERRRKESSRLRGPPTLKELRELSERLEQRCRLEDIFAKESNRTRIAPMSLPPRSSLSSLTSLSKLTVGGSKGKLMQQQRKEDSFSSSSLLSTKVKKEVEEEEQKKKEDGEKMKKKEMMKGSSKKKSSMRARIQEAQDSQYLT